MSPIPTSAPFDAAGAREVKYSVAEVISWDPNRVEREFVNRHPPVSRDNKWPAKVPLPSEREVARVFPFLLATYGVMLCICDIERSRDRWRQKGAFWAVEKLYYWMRDDLGVVAPYEFAVAVDMFLSKDDRRNKARKLFKYGGGEAPDEIADKAWNAAWDVYFVRLPEGMTYGLISGVDPKASALITANKDPRYLRLSSELKTLIDAGDLQLPLTLSESDSTMNPEDAKLLGELLKVNPLDTVTRGARDPEELLGHALEAVKDLESRMGVERKTADGYRMIVG